MTSRETPTAVLLYERVSKLNNDVDRFTLGGTFYFRLARHDRSVVAVKSRLHIVIFENVIMDSSASGVFDVVGGRADFAF